MPKRQKPEPAQQERGCVYFCPERRANYHLDRAGARIYHGVPAGLAFNADGELIPASQQETTTDG